MDSINTVLDGNVMLALKTGSRTVPFSIQRQILRNKHDKFYGNRYTVYADIELPDDFNAMCEMYSAVEKFAMNQLGLTRHDLMSGDLWNQKQLHIFFKGDDRNARSYRAS